MPRGTPSWTRLGLALAAVGGAHGCRNPAQPGGATLAPSPPSGPTVVGPTTPTDVGPDTPIGALTFHGAPPHNLIVVSIDTARRDRFGRWSGLGTTPFLDGWLGGAFVLDQHRSCSNWTAPSMVCALSGWFPVNHGFWPNAHDPEVPPIPADLEPLAVLAGRAGYATELVTTNPVFSDEASSLAAGFDVVELHDWMAAENVAAIGLDRAEALLAAGAPFYLHLHLMDLHDPYCPPPGYDEGMDDLPDPGFEVCGGLTPVVDAWDEVSPETKAATVEVIDASYRNEVRYVDDVLSGLLADLEGAGVLDDALVLVFTDHGEQMNERGALRHGNDLYAEENLAFAALWAHDLEPGAWTAPTWHPDLAATVAAALGWRFTRPIDGEVVGTAAPGLSSRASGAVAERVTPYMSYFVASPLELGVATSTRSLLYDWAGGRAMFHTDADPAERTDLYDPVDPDVVALWGPMALLVDRVSLAFDHLGPPVEAAP